MRAEHDPVWKKLQAFDLEAADAKLNFTLRLARENGWSVSQARQVVGEYKKFLWMAVHAGHPVTPSDEVDQAWHLHLVYTESYWNDLCRDILGRPLHHGPTRGGAAEDAKYHDWYAKTLAFYEASFGHAPPDAVWPAPEQRFHRGRRFQRVDKGSHWVLSKAVWQPRLRAAALVASAVVLTDLAMSWRSGSRSAGEGQNSLLGAELVIFLGVIGFFVLVALLVATRKKGGGDGSGCSTTGGCSSSGNDSGGSSGCGSSGCGGGGCGGGD
jgi:hypothetical protein